MMHVLKACAVGRKCWVWGKATAECVLRVYSERVDISSELGHRRGRYWRRISAREMSDSLLLLAGEPSVGSILTTHHTCLLHGTFCDVGNCPDGLAVELTGPLIGLEESSSCTSR